MFAENVLWAFSLTLLAGLATGVGSVAALFARRTNTRLLSVSLGFSAGVMVYVSFVEILTKARVPLVAELGLHGGSWAVLGAFFAGILFIGLIDRFVPERENPHEMHRIEEMRPRLDPADPLLFSGPDPASPQLLRMGLFSALAIAIHNFPEGLATFTVALRDPNLGLPIAAAIAIHNIPEGIAVAVPVYYATGSRRKAFTLSFLSGFAEPVGALVGYVLLMPFMSEILFGVLFASVAGVMVYISFDELLPAAHEYGRHHHALFGLIAGMAVMGVSLVLFL